jgi:hypothetical protein
LKVVLEKIFFKNACSLKKSIIFAAVLKNRVTENSSLKKLKCSFSSKYPQVRKEKFFEEVVKENLKDI